MFALLVEFGQTGEDVVVLSTQPIMFTLQPADVCIVFLGDTVLVGLHVFALAFGDVGTHVRLVQSLLQLT